MKYCPASFAPPLLDRELREFQTMLQVDFLDFEFESSYLAHIRAYHGGRPITNKILTKTGRRWMVDRFLNFCDSESGGPHVRFNANVVWSAIEDRLRPTLVPFAADPGGNYFCFDYSGDGRPAIVLWLHEESNEGLPVTLPVADDFDAFLSACDEG